MKAPLETVTYELSDTIELSQLPETIDVSELPNSISQTFNTINKLDEKINIARQKAEDAQLRAVKTKEQSAGWSWNGGKKKAAIEDLQGVVEEIATAQCEAISAQSVIFENQQKMAESVRYLFGLGVMNIAANRTVVRTLELKLRNASEDELSELAKQELINTINQLKSQENIISRLDKQKNKIIELEAIINEQKQLISNIVNDNMGIITKEIVTIKQDIKQARIDDNKSHLDKIDRLVRSSNSRFDTIEKRMSKIDTSFLQSYLYKISIGVIAIIALLCSIVL